MERKIGVIPPRARLADLAAAAGVSTATVSRVLNGKPGVAESTRSSVMAALRALGMPPSETTAGFVAVVIPELANPGFASFATELSLRFSAAGQNMMMFTTGPGANTELQYLEAMQPADVVGLVSVSGTLADSLVSHEQYRRLTAAGLPVVVINAYDPQIEASFFSCSDAEAVAMSVSHLRSFEHERIGLAVGQQRYQPSVRKLEAFLGLGFDESSVASTTFTVEGGHAAAARLLDAGHTAIVCGSDVMALGAIREAKSRGLDVPGDVSIVGYDDSPLMAFTAPALTTVRQPVPTMCQAAVRALLAMINGQPAEPTEMLFHPDLIIRQSTGPKP